MTTRDCRINFHRQTWSALAFLCCIFLSACGFKKTSPLNFPPQLQPLAVDISEPYGALSKKLQVQLKRAHIHYIMGAESNHYVLHLEEQMLPEKVLTVATTTRIRQNQLTYQLRYQLTAPAGETLIPLKVVEIIRTHYQNLDNLLGTHHDRDLLEDEMKAEALTAMIYQLRAQNTQQLITNYQNPHYYAD